VARLTSSPIEDQTGGDDQGRRRKTHHESNHRLQRANFDIVPHHGRNERRGDHIAETEQAVRGDEGDHAAAGMVAAGRNRRTRRHRKQSSGRDRPRSKSGADHRTKPAGRWN